MNGLSPESDTGENNEVTVRKPAKGVSRVLRATLEYDGSRYRGWQSQINARTVQGVFYGACQEVLGKDLRIFGAGRTDAGVHAFAQVASLHDTVPVAPSELGSLREKINDRLPADIHVLDLQLAPPGFHARPTMRGLVMSLKSWIYIPNTPQPL